jgi:ring-1,2-phenylacetyl-CoA epoxidase subunit PaaB
MSKLREEVPLEEGALSGPLEGDLRPYVIFTQLRVGGPFIYAGWLDAADDAMAIQFAREHYGQDQKCLHLWAVAREHLAGTDAQYPTCAQAGAQRPFVVFRQEERGGAWESIGEVSAAHSEAAVAAARRLPGGGAWTSIWVIDRAHIASTRDDDLIWRLVDQSYRLARGYSQSVREKWEKVRAERDIEEYEREDLKETF